MFRENIQNANYYVVCDKCGKRLGLNEYLTISEARLDATNAGWLTVEKDIYDGEIEHFCPDCYRYGLSLHPHSRILGPHKIMAKYKGYRTRKLIRKKTTFATSFGTITTKYRLVDIADNTMTDDDLEEIVSIIFGKSKEQ